MRDISYTKEQFVEAWDYHINQLTRLFPTSSEDGLRLIEIKRELREIVGREADLLYTVEPTSVPCNNINLEVQS